MSTAQQSEQVHALRFDLRRLFCWFTFIATFLTGLRFAAQLQATSDGRIELIVLYYFGLSVYGSLLGRWMMKSIHSTRHAWGTVLGAFLSTVALHAITVESVTQIIPNSRDWATQLCFYTFVTAVVAVVATFLDCAARDIRGIVKRFIITP